jgi:hypothetical protein
VLDTSADVSFQKRVRARETQETVRGAVANNNIFYGKLFSFFIIDFNFMSGFTGCVSS